MNPQHEDFLSIDEVAMTAHQVVYDVMLAANKEGKCEWWKKDIHIGRAKTHLAQDDEESLPHALTRIAMEITRRKHEKV